MVQIYHGNGKGKTTAACGLAVRAAGRQIPVLFGQFLKDDSSGEVPMLRKLGIDTLHMSVFYGFVSRMDERQLAETRQACARMLDETERRICEWLAEARGDQIDYADAPEALVVWDEILHAVRFGLLDEASVIAMLDRYRGRVEFVLTGQNPSDAMLAAADYVTEMKCVRHPYEKGIFARKGIEL